MLVDIAAFPEEVGVLAFDEEDPEAELPDAALLREEDAAGVVPVVAAALGAAVAATEVVAGVVPFKQLVLPNPTVNGADCENNPELSRREISRLVLGAKFTEAQV